MIFKSKSYKTLGETNLNPPAASTGTVSELEVGSPCAEGHTPLLAASIMEMETEKRGVGVR